MNDEEKFQRMKRLALDPIEVQRHLMPSDDPDPLRAAPSSRARKAAEAVAGSAVPNDVAKIDFLADLIDRAAGLSELEHEVTRLRVELQDVRDDHWGCGASVEEEKALRQRLDAVIVELTAWMACQGNANVPHALRLARGEEGGERSEG